MNQKRNLKPVGDRIMLRSEKVSNKKKIGGVTLYTTTDEQAAREEAGNLYHEVIAMGPDCFKDDCFKSNWCEVGDTVITMRYPGQKIEFDDHTIWFANDQDILAVVEKENG